MTYSAQIRRSPWLRRIFSFPRKRVHPYVPNTSLTATALIALGETVVAVWGSATGRFSESAALIAFVVAVVLISTLGRIYFGLGDDQRGLRTIGTAPHEQRASLALRSDTTANRQGPDYE